MENNKPKQQKPPKNEEWKKEELTEQDWLEIMNVNMPTYKRVNGRIRRKR